MSQEKIQGGAMGGVEELYREVILDHFKTPKNRGVLPNANAKADGMNPLCGDQLTMQAVIENGRLADVKFEGHGCAISQSAASMLTQVVKGKTIEELQRLARIYKGMFGVEVESGKTTAVTASEPPEELGDLVALEGVKKYPVRIKCALLSANTLLETIQNFQKK
jgi:nitrogen fixation NifU-like protein